MQSHLGILLRSNMELIASDGLASYKNKLGSHVVVVFFSPFRHDWYKKLSEFDISLCSTTSEQDVTMSQVDVCIEVEEARKS